MVINRLSVVLKMMLVLSVMVVWGCSSHEDREIPERFQDLTDLTIIPADIQPENTIKIKRDISYGSTSDVLIDIVGSFAVDDSGRVYMTAGGPKGINIFNADGRYLTRIGREGRGPGEFASAPAIYIKSNRLYVIDIMSYRINIFSVDSLSLIRSVNINPTNKPDELTDYNIHQVLPIGNGTYLTGFDKFLRNLSELPVGSKVDTLYRRHYYFESDGRLNPKQVLEVKDQPVIVSSFFGGVGPTTFQFFDKPLIAVSNNGTIYAANSNEFLIKEYSTDGHYLRAIFHPYKNVELTREATLEDYPAMRNQVRPGISTSMLEYIIDARQRIIRQIDLPQNWPALNDLLVDDKNRLWVSTIVEDFDVYKWWVMEPSGELITKFKWPRDEPIEVIKNGKIYTRETDEDTGLQRVVRYGIVM